MGRKTFYDILESMEIDPAKEYERIDNMFSREGAIDSYGSPPSTLQSYINKRYFRTFSFRGTHTDISEMLSLIFKGKGPFDVDFDTLFTYFEFLLAVFCEKNVLHDILIAQSRQATTIIQNIKLIVNKTNHELYNTGDANSPKYIIVENNKSTTQAVELVNDQTVAIELIEYNHHSMKGDLEGKRKTLLAIADYIEPILKSRKLQDNGYKQLESDVGFLLNCFHIRHNNKTGSKAQDYITSIDDEQLEEWYDNAYNTMLSVIIISEEIGVSAELTGLKQTYNWKR